MEPFASHREIREPLSGFHDHHRRLGGRVNLPISSQFGYLHLGYGRTQSRHFTALFVVRDLRRDTYCGPLINPARNPGSLLRLRPRLAFRRHQVRPLSEPSRKYLCGYR